MDENRKKALELALLGIEKQYGKGAVMPLNTSSKADVEVISSGVVSLDAALGIGGYPRGRIIEVFGPESSGKTTLSLHAIAEAQRAGGVAAFIDAEHALDVGYARKLGVKVDELLVSQPDNGEQALEISDMLVRSGAVDLVVIDSVAALVPKAEIEGEMGDQLPGLQARLMSQALRKLTATVHRSNTLLLFINQMRMKIGVMFGNPETTTGGNALKFYASMRLDIRRVGSLKNGDQVIGNRTKVKVVKNKMAAPFKEVELDILYGQGMSKTGDLLDTAAEVGIIEKGGSWYSYKSERIGQGREAAKTYLEEHSEVFARVESELLSHFGIKRAGASNGKPEEKPEAAQAPVTASRKDKDRPKAQA